MTVPTDPSDQAAAGTDPAGPGHRARPIGVGDPHRPALGWTEIVIGVVVYVLVSLGLGVGVDVATDGSPSTLVVVALSTLAGLTAAVVAVAVRVRSFAALGVRRTTWRFLLLGAAGGLLARLVGIVVIVYYGLLTGNRSNPQQELTDAATGSTASLVGVLVLGALVVPVTEELLFRGVLFGGLHRRYGLVVATVGSALLFGLAHLSIVVGLAAVGLAVINGLLYHHSRSIWPGVLAHAVNNAIALGTAAFVLG